MLNYACALSDTLKLPCCPEWPLLAWENGSITLPLPDVSSPHFNTFPFFFSFYFEEGGLPLPAVLSGHAAHPILG